MNFRERWNKFSMFWIVQHVENFGIMLNVGYFCGFCANNSSRFWQNSLSSGRNTFSLICWFFTQFWRFLWPIFYLCCTRFERVWTFYKTFCCKNFLIFCLSVLYFLWVFFRFLWIFFRFLWIFFFLIFRCLFWLSKISVRILLFFQIVLFKFWFFFKFSYHLEIFFDFCNFCKLRFF